jgi:hypothetical protein
VEYSAKEVSTYFDFEQVLTSDFDGDASKILEWLVRTTVLAIRVQDAPS